MTEETRLARKEQQEISLPILQEIGTLMAKSGYFQDAREMAQAVVKVMAGKELGIPPVASMTGINIIKGKVGLSANLLAGLIKRSGKYDYRVLELTDTACEIRFFQGTESIGVSRFDVNDAKRAETQNMGKFPRNMLFARAMSNGAKWFCADVFDGPVYTPEELGATVDERGDVITLKAETKAPKSKKEAAESAAETTTDAPANVLEAEVVDADADLAAEAKAREEAEAQAQQQDPPVTVDRSAVWGRLSAAAKKTGKKQSVLMSELTGKNSMTQMSDAEVAAMDAKLGGL